MIDSKKLADKLDGQLLIAMPGMNDPRFKKTVIYICSHSNEGAMGIVINRPHKGLKFAELLSQLNIAPDTNAPRKIEVLSGGPVEQARGFVLHSKDYFTEGATLKVDPGLSLTATTDVLRALAKGEGPAQALFALGYAGWGAGQLEQELIDNAWITCDSDADLIFDEDHNGKYSAALDKLGIDPGLLSSEAGHA